MLCPRCKHYNNKIIFTLTGDFSVKRRRICLKCSYKWYTVEVQRSLLAQCPLVQIYNLKQGKSETDIDKEGQWLKDQNEKE